MNEYEQFLQTITPNPSQGGTTSITLRIGTVTAATQDSTGWYVSLNWNVDSDITNVVRCISSYFPVIDDVVRVVLVPGAGPLVLGTIIHDNWNVLTLPTGYTVLAGYGVPSYRRDPTGRVWLSGIANVAGTTAAGTKFTIPLGWRPPFATVLPVPWGTATAFGGTQRYEISTAGVISTAAASAGPSTTLHFFDGMSWTTS